MAETFHVEVVAASQSVWEGEATQLTATTTEGEIGILARHGPLLAMLAGGDTAAGLKNAALGREPGPVVVTTADGRSEVIAVDGGFLAVESDRTAVISPYAQLAEEISLDEAQANLRRAQAKRDGGDNSPQTLRDYHRAIAQVKAVSRKV
ncbi:MAG: F0F1 ATP synthase subunit epsilon [Propionibacteriaceae bacterium]|jgi:F-type H+-transporting ATPase subunit epsilon|nr:F0F1 ATP synthase subunit epsilon [Propionibacteriaceae bacterium]